MQAEEGGAHAREKRRRVGRDAPRGVEHRALDAELGEPGKTRLKEAQRRWLAWRDAQCAFEASSVDGGSAAPMVTSQCLDQLTQAQTRLLDSHLHCQEGDISCSN
ncbi:lysozyme inhibitor LprI family protein [Burkholderia gladioli]|uniref:lysozyme inhibitor LprI family protein n=1 Tax=Burkholderia gladioli TaxID=28095 RepID=UPI0034DAFBB5